MHAPLEMIVHQNIRILSSLILKLFQTCMKFVFYLTQIIVILKNVGNQTDDGLR